MKSVPVQKTAAPGAEMCVGKSGDLSTLRSQTGFLKKIGVDLATSDAAGEGLKKVLIEQVNAETNIALTGLKLTEAAIRTSMVANAMPQIGALTTRVNAATTSVDQALTNGSAAETFTHLTNRAANIGLANELRGANKITQDEAEVIVSFAEADAAEDIKRSRERMGEAKEAVAGLHQFALKGIADAKNRLS
jgi:hypothetical protein